MNRKDSGYIIPVDAVEGIYDYWVTPSFYERALTPEERAERAERIRHFNRPWPRFVRWLHGLRWRLHDRLYPECAAGEWDE